MSGRAVITDALAASQVIAKLTISALELLREKLAAVPELSLEADAARDGVIAILASLQQCEAVLIGNAGQTEQSAAALH